MYLQEKAYILDYLFQDVLQLKINVEEIWDKSQANYVLDFGGKILEIKDSFFGNLLIDDLSYLDKKNIPENVVWVKNPYTNDLIPGIYGENKFVLKEGYVYCGLDIIASTFFMLTRWEEIVLPKDEHGRPLEEKMFVVKHNLYQRPIVNEYIELLRNMLISLGISLPEVIVEFTPFVTHDVDNLFRYASFRNFCMNLAGDLLHRKSLKFFFLTCFKYVRYRLGKIKDPFDTFDELMDLSDKVGIKNAFYFIPSFSAENDARYNIFDPRIKNIINHIEERGHEVGIHPSKNTFHNKLQFQEEMKRLYSLTSNIKGGRQHFLLYDVIDSFQNWDEGQRLEYDAGLGFYDRAGFRCGICYPYPVFDLHRRSQLGLIEKPLIVMECALLRNNTRQYEAIYQEIVELIDVVRKYNGWFVFLWHNDNLNRIEAAGYKFIYTEVIRYLSQKTVKSEE